MQNIRIQGREYTVTTTEHTATMPYLLTGPRGAVYGAFRFVPDIRLMYVASYRGGELRIAGNAVRLTDEGGELREAVR